MKILCYKIYKRLLYSTRVYEIMEEYRNYGIFDVDRKQMQAVDGKQEIDLE